MPDEGTEPGISPNEVVAGNLAYQLFNLLQSWAVPINEYPEQSRGFGKRNFRSLDRWREHTQAMEVVRQLDNAVEALEVDGQEVDMFWDFMPRLYAATYAVVAPWGSTDSQRERYLLDDGDFALLRALGALLDAYGALKLRYVDVTELEAALEKVRELLSEEIEGMPPDVRRYIRGLVLRAQAVLDMAESAGSEAARRLMVELSGALNIRADVEDARNPGLAGRLRNLARDVVTPFATGAGSRTAELVGEAARAALEAGSS